MGHLRAPQQTFSYNLQEPMTAMVNINAQHIGKYMCGQGRSVVSFIISMLLPYLPHMIYIAHPWLTEDVK